MGGSLNPLKRKVEESLTTGRPPERIGKRIEELQGKLENLCSVGNVVDGVIRVEDVPPPVT